jgi:HSP20 family molecular chaperone IbpA
LGERWWRRKRRFDPWFRDVFEETDKTERIIDDMIRQAFGSPEEREKARRYYVYQFGPLNSTHSGGSQIGKYDPLVDVISEEKNVVVVAELLGVYKDQIKIHASEDKIEISVGSPRWKILP